MREPTALVKEYDQQLEIVPEQDSSLSEAFYLPVRNWNLIIDSYNAENKKKFRFTALQCRQVIEYIKKGIPTPVVFKNVGISPQHYGRLVNNYLDLEDKFVELQYKDTLSEEEYEEFQSLMRHPMRILMADVQRAEAICSIADWENFNDKAFSATDLLAMKMKAKYKDFFGERGEETGGSQVVINIGGDWLQKL